MCSLQVLVDRAHLATTRLREVEVAGLRTGQVQVRVDSFALTANNITYAAFGAAMNYWQFFPTGDAAWGMIPVWGFGEIVRSTHPELPVGERLYGYYPMATDVILTPQRVRPESFSDAAPHRTGLHAVYNQYLRCSADPLYTPETEDFQALLRPLFLTSWLLDDFLADNDFFGASTLMLSSASSKTAYGTAFQLMQRAEIEVIGLTSAANVAFCQSLGCYRRVIAYEQLDQTDAQTPCIYIDFAGNAGLRQRIHERFAHLRYSCSVGGTHLEQIGSAKDLTGPRPVLFFAPAQASKRVSEWGAKEFGARIVQDWRAFCAKVTQGDPPWLVVEHARGSQAVLAVYAQVLGGRSDPRVGHILLLRP